MLLVMVVVIGGVVGGTLFAFGGDDAPVTATTLPTPTAPLADSADDRGGRIGAESTGDVAIPDGTAVPDDGVFGERGGRQGGAFQPTSGSLASADAAGVTLTTATGDTTLAIPPETPVRLSRTVAEAAANLTPGVELIALLTRETDGTFSATNIIIGGAGGGRLGGGGGAFGGGGTAQDGTEFNAVPGTIIAFANGVLSLDTTDGPIDITVAADVTIQLTIAFSASGSELTVGESITVLGQTADDGTYTPITIATGDLGQLGGGGRRGGTGDFPQP